VCIRGIACRRPAYSAKHTTVLSLSLKECICLSVQKVKNAGCAHASSCKWSASVLQGALHRPPYISSKMVRCLHSRQEDTAPSLRHNNGFTEDQPM
jgi:hypothetical protein